MSNSVELSIMLIVLFFFLCCSFAVELLRRSAVLFVICRCAFLMQRPDVQLCVVLFVASWLCFCAATAVYVVMSTVLQLTTCIPATFA